jgi:hypothetical protein
MSGKESTVFPQSHRWNSGPALRADDLELKATIASRLLPGAPALTRDCTFAAATMPASCGGGE